MTRKDWLEIGAIVLGGAGVLWLLNRDQAATASGDTGASNLPSYLAYNQPNYNAVPATSLPTIGTGGSDGASTASCACGGQSTFMFSGAPAYVQSLYNNANDFLTQYEQDINSQFPTFVSQFFNDQAGITQQNVTMNELQSF